MKNRIFIAALGLGLIWSSLGHAEWYAGVGMGWSSNNGYARDEVSQKHAFKDSMPFSVFGGYELPLPLFDVRGEVEFIDSKIKTKGTDSKRFDALFFNTYATIPMTPIFDPYIGFGIGEARFDHKNTVSLQGIMGIEYEFVSAPVVTGLEYRYLKNNETTGKHDATSKYHTNTFMLKLKYLF